MWFVRQSAKADCFIASRAEIKCVLKKSRTRSKELVLKTILNDFQRETAITKQSADASLDQRTTLHMRLLSFVLKASISFSRNLVRAQMVVQSIALIRLGIMNQAMCAGQRSWNRQPIGCQGTIG